MFDNFYTLNGVTYRRNADGTFHRATRRGRWVRVTFVPMLLQAMTAR